MELEGREPVIMEYRHMGPSLCALKHRLMQCKAANKLKVNKMLIFSTITLYLFTFLFILS